MLLENENEKFPLVENDVIFQNFCETNIFHSLREYTKWFNRAFHNNKFQ